MRLFFIGVLLFFIWIELDAIRKSMDKIAKCQVLKTQTTIINPVDTIPVDTNNQIYNWPTLY